MGLGIASKLDAEPLAAAQLRSQLAVALRREVLGEDIGRVDRRVDLEDADLAVLDEIVDSRSSAWCP